MTKHKKIQNSNHTKKKSEKEIMKSVKEFLNSTSKYITYKNCESTSTGKGFEKNRGVIQTVCDTKRNMKGLKKECIEFQVEVNGYTKKEAAKIC